ncbi:MAG: PHP domain-containing protein, partial [Pseudomonadota bacterium]
MASKTDNLHNALKASPGSSGVPDSNAEGKFVHLHVHSAFSLLEGALPLKKIIDLAVADKQPAIAVTDRNNLFGALEFSEKASKEGLQPIMGCKLAVNFADGLDAKSRSGIGEFPFLVLLA